MYKKFVFIFLLFTLALTPSIASSWGWSWGWKWKKSNVEQWVDLLPSLSWSPPSKAFGNHSTGTVTSQEFTLTNSGNDIAEDVTISVAGAAFSLYSTTAFGNISSGRSRVAKVRFSPVAATAYSGFVNYSAPNIARTGAALSGTGINTEYACTSGTYTSGVDLINGSASGTSTVSSAQNGGESFLLPQQIAAYAVGMHVNTVTVAGDFECRLSATNDPTTTYLATTGVINITTTGAKLFTLTTHPVLSAATTYYFACAPAGDGTGSILIKRLVTDYPDGTRLSHIGSGFGVLSNTTSDWAWGIQACAD